MYAAQVKAQVINAYTGSLSALLITDFQLTRGRRPGSLVERFNWAGIIALVVGFGVSYYLFTTGIFQLGFLVTLALTPTIYLALRRTILRPGVGTSYVKATAALREIEDEEAVAV